jgi:hypothetical protein
VFPFGFIIIACGAISGFHSLVASGTTPKLIACESDARMVGYGAMLIESLVAVMALIAACVLTPGVYFAINAPAGALGTTVQSAAVAIHNWGFALDPVEMQNLTTDGGDDLYFFKGVFHTPTDMIDPAKKSGAFAPIAKRIAKDAAKLTDADENWTLCEQARSDESQGLSGAVPRQDRRLGDRSPRCGVQHRIRVGDEGSVQPQYGGLHHH